MEEEERGEGGRSKMIKCRACKTHKPDPLLFKGEVNKQHLNTRGLSLQVTDGAMEGEREMQMERDKTKRVTERNRQKTIQA